MYDQNELDALARAAKMKLKKQEEDQSPAEDMYAQFREEDGDEGYDEQSYEPIESPQIRHSPDYGDDGPVIRSDMDPDDYESEEREEVDPLDTPVFPGGPRLSQMQTWKKEWADHRLYIIEISGEYFVFRTLNRFEYKQIITLDLDQLQREEVICETCVLHPNNFTWKNMVKQMAGIPSTLATVIMEKSGFTQEYSIQMI